MAERWPQELEDVRVGIHQKKCIEHQRECLKISESYCEEK